MAQAAWEKPVVSGTSQDQQRAGLTSKKSERLKYLIGGLLMMAAIGYLIVSGTLTGQQFFITVDEMLGKPEYVGQTVRITGAVVGSTIQEQTVDGKYTINFKVASIPLRTENLAETLHLAASDPNATLLSVHVENQPKPELLKNEAQAIMTGKLGSDGVFRVSELQFKCPSRFQESGPKVGEQDHPGMQAQDQASSANAG